MNALTRIGFALLSGLLLALAWPVDGFAPLVFIAFVPLILLQDKIGDKTIKGNIFFLSFLAFLLWNALTTWWIARCTIAGSIAAVLLNSIFMATVFYAYHFIKTRLYNNKKGYFLLILLFASFEYLHLNWQLNWPWLNLGNVFSHYYTWVQWYEYTGSAGGTLWVLAVNILLYKLLFGFDVNRYSHKLETKANFSLAKAKWSHLGKYSLRVFLMIVVPLLISKVIYYSYEETGDDVEVVVVQPNLDPYTEEFVLSPYEIMERNLSVASTMMTDNTSFVISPESAIQEDIWIEHIDRYYSVHELRKFINNYPNTCYVIGMSTLGLAPDDAADDFAARKFVDADKYYYAYNTAALIDKDSIQMYQKSRLTPGVEMVPSWWFLRPFVKIGIDLGGTTGTLKTDTEPKLLSFNGLDVATLICYESVFGGYVTEFVKKGAQMIFVITNDGWWGDTPGYQQHLEMSQLRAIETRRSIARSANTGVSCFINQRGDIMQKTDYNTHAALRNTLKTNDKQTFYVCYGDYIYKIAVFLTMMVSVITLVRIITKRK